MAICKYTPYKYVNVEGNWCYCKAAYHDNGKIKPDTVFVNMKEELLEKHTAGRYYVSRNGQWTDAGTATLEAQRKRKQRLAFDGYHRRSGANSVKNTGAPLVAGRITLAAVAEKYFANGEARGLDAKTIRKYRFAVDLFVHRCGVTYFDECRDNKEVLLDYMGWLRKQPVAVRKPSDGCSSNNPKRTLANRLSDVQECNLVPCHRREAGRTGPTPGGGIRPGTGHCSVRESGSWHSLGGYRCRRLCCHRRSPYPIDMEGQCIERAISPDREHGSCEPV
jgi:hypothetical protein